MTWESIQKFGGLKPGTKVLKGAALFPRVDVKKELEALSGGTEEAPEKEEKKPEKKAEPPEGRGSQSGNRHLRRLHEDQAHRREGHCLRKGGQVR